MKRVYVAGGAWSAILVVAAACLAADVNKRQGNQPASPPATPVPSSGGGQRFPPPSGHPYQSDQAHRNAEAAQAAQTASSLPPAFRNAAAAQIAKAQAAAARDAAAAQAARNSYLYGSYSPNGFGFSPNGYGNSPYGYSPYGYPYAPNGTTPYALSYDPYSGATYAYPYQGGYYPTSGYSPYGYRYSYYSNPYLGYGYPGAVFVNPGQLYGVGPIQQLMGVDQWFRPQQNAAPFAGANPIVAGNIAGNIAGNNVNGNPGFGNGNAAANVVAGNPPAAPKPAAGGGGKALELAWKFITFGDAQFANLKYSDAMERYRRAAREYPRLGDAWFREGFALAAMGKYDQAAKAVRRGLEEKPDWADANFRLDEIYGDNGADKRDCVNRLVKASEAEPTNGDLALIVGIHLFSDGRVDQAAPFFRRAAQIQGDDADVKPFLAKAQN